MKPPHKGLALGLASVSVDLDEIPCYSAIHGIETLDRRALRAVYQKAIPRFEALFRERKIHATFFVIGRDLDDAGNDRVLGRLKEQGHEIGNHSFHHRYDLTRCPREVISAEVSESALAIERAIGERPKGFRAPGYNINRSLIDVLEEQGYAYDSSVFPSPPYYAAKVLALLSMGIRGRQSASILGDPRVLTAPTSPYRVGRTPWSRGSGILELPIGVTSLMTGRLPYIGTTLVLARERGATLLTNFLPRDRFVNLEFHGIDLADAEEDGLRALFPYQPDLRRPVKEKLNAIRASLDQLVRRGYDFITLAEAAEVHASGA